MSHCYGRCRDQDMFPMEAEEGQGQKATLKLTGIPLKMVVVHPHPAPAWWKPPSQRWLSSLPADTWGAADTCSSLRQGLLLKAVLVPPLVDGLQGSRKCEMKEAAGKREEGLCGSPPVSHHRESLTVLIGSPWGWPKTSQSCMCVVLHPK